MAKHSPHERRKSYGWTAAVYSTAERLVFGNQLMRARLALLPELQLATRVLIVGEGDGRFLAALVRQNPHSSIVVVDRSRRMLDRAAYRLSAATPNVRFVQQDATEFLAELEPSTTFDAIVTLFVLDCLTATEVDALVGTAARRLTPGGAWLWADFSVPRAWPLRWVAEVMLQLLYWFFRATTDTSGQNLVDAGPVFTRVGLHEQVSSYALGGLVRARYLRLETRT